MKEAKQTVQLNAKKHEEAKKGGKEVEEFSDEIKDKVLGVLRNYYMYIWIKKLKYISCIY